MGVEGLGFPQLVGVGLLGVVSNSRMVLGKPLDRGLEDRRVSVRNRVASDVFLSVSVRKGRPSEVC